MENKKTLCNMTYYTRRGQRVSAFGEVFGNKLVISYWICSKDDVFNRKFSRDVWNKHFYLTVREVKDQIGVTINQVTIEIGNSPKIAFNEWLANSFFSMEKIPTTIYHLVPGIEKMYYRIISKQFKK